MNVTSLKLGMCLLIAAAGCAGETKLALVGPDGGEAGSAGAGGSGNSGTSGGGSGGSAGSVPEGLRFVRTQLPHAQVNVAYSARLEGAGGAGPYTFALAAGESLPAGLSLASNGAITGTPSSAFDGTIGVTITDADGDSVTDQIALMILVVSDEVSIVASRMSGVAPLAVSFDASGTTSDSTSHPFHDLSYEWDFDDPESGNWPDTASPRNRAIGPIAAHVFGSPGTYRVALSVFEAGAEMAGSFIEIVVTDPNQVFAGDKTVCLSTGGDFTGCPSGAQTVTLSNWDEAAQYVATDRRILLRRGESFSATEGIRIAPAGPGMIGAYGDCVAPNARGICSNAPVITSTGGFVLVREGASDWRIADLDVGGSGSDTGTAVNVDGANANLLLWRTKVHDFHEMVGGQDAAQNPTIADCELAHVVGGTGGYVLYWGGDGFSLLGSSCLDAVDGEHVVRLTSGSNIVVDHNVLGDPADNKHSLKIHASHGPTEWTERVVVTHNVFDPPPSSGWAIAIGPAGPQDSNRDQNVREAIIDSNVFAPSQGHAIRVSANDVTLRNNVFKGSYGISVDRYADGDFNLTPNGARIYNNLGMGAGLVGVGLATDVVVMNNIWFSPDTSGNDGLYLGCADDCTITEITADYNLVFKGGSPGALVVQSAGSGNRRTLEDWRTNFGQDIHSIEADPAFMNAAVGDFRLMDGSPAINAGTPVAGVLRDLLGNSRPSGAAIDIGPVERSE